MANKLIRDGKVAILYSPGFGAGWSTWGVGDQKAMVFDQELVEAVLAGDKDKILEVAERKFPDDYMGGLRDIAVEWIDEGAAFTIEEYDGSESIRFSDRINYIA